MNVLENEFGMHAKVLGLRSQRMELLARNIANADTPKFKAQDIDFKQVMQHAQDTAMATTHAGHVAQGDAGDAGGVKFRTPFNTSFDGNTVELNIEQANYGKSAGDYQATLSFLEQRVSSIRKALRGD